MFRRRFTLWLLPAVALAALCLTSPAGADSSGPVVVLESPAEGAGFYQGQQVQAAFACLPGPLGWPAIECAGDVPLGAFIDTSSVGSHTFSVHAVDYAGAETTVTDSSQASGSLGYNASVDRYVFLAKTDRSWAGSCKQLVLTLRDATVHRANVSFR